MCDIKQFDDFGFENNLAVQHMISRIIGETVVEDLLANFYHRSRTAPE